MGIFQDIIIVRRLFGSSEWPDKFMEKYMPEITFQPGVVFDQYDVLKAVHALPLARREAIFRSIHE